MSKFKHLYERIYKKWPFAIAGANCLMTGCASDSIAQCKLEQTKRMDWKRNARFATWNGAYCGVFQHWVYNIFYARLFPSASAMSKMSCTAFDLTIHGPLVYMPFYFVCKSLMTGGSAKAGYNEWWQDKWSITAKYLKFWMPTIFVTMFWIKPEFRVLTISAFSLFWMIMVSYMAPMANEDAKK